MAIPRSIAQLTLTHPLSDGVLHAVDLLQTQYGANSYRDSGHTETAPTWIFELTDYGAEVGLRMNGGVLTLYMRNRTLDGQTLTDWLSPEKVAKVYPRDGSPAGSIKRSTYLRPSLDNECVMLRLERDDLRPLFDYFFDIEETTTQPEGQASDGVSIDHGRMPPPIDEDSFQALLERRSELGRMGEQIAFEDEVHRLKGLGCPDPRNWVKVVAQEDVGRGYDIESWWHGHERCIEVKMLISTQK